MRDFLCELKLPGVIIGVVTIVWCTALHSREEQSAYYPPDEEFVRLREQGKQTERKSLDDDAVVRLELNP